MRRSLGMRSASFALRSQPFALVGHLVFSFSGWILFMPESFQML
jgi:hypothetical protein